MPNARGRTALAILAVDGSDAGNRDRASDRLADLRRAVETALAAPMRPVIVVIGADPQPAVEQLAGRHVILAMNRDWAEGLNSYVRAAVLTAMAEPHLAALALWRGDQPDVSSGDLARLHQAHEGLNADLVAAAQNGRLDLPAVFARPYFRELLALRQRDRLADWLNTRRDFVSRVEMPGAFGPVSVPRERAGA